MPKKAKTKAKTKRRTKTKLTSKGFLKWPSRSRLIVFIVIFGVIGAATALFSLAATGDGSVPVYRLVQSSSGEHLLTASKTEVDSLVPKAGFSNEGVGFSAWLDANNGRVPAYRLYPKVGGKHLITTSETEKTSLVNSGAWSLEGVAFYVYSAPGAGRIPVYRLINAGGDHLLTSSAFEKDQLVANKSYGLEGIAFYASGSLPAQNVHKPTGAVDPSGCGTVVGWALDGDNLADPEPVHIYIEGTGYNTGNTSLLRTDVNRIYYASGNHGYSFAIPDKWKDGKIHQADVYAININSEGKVDGDNVLIGSKQFACNGYGQDVTAQLQAAAAAKAQQQAAYIAAANAAKQLQAEPTLQFGSTGPAVAAFQQRLANRGFWIAADGTFGTTTDHWVRAFKIEIGLGNSGVIDAATYAAMSQAEVNDWHFNANDPLLGVIQPPEPPVVVNRNPPTPQPAPFCFLGICFPITPSQPAPAPQPPASDPDPSGTCVGFTQNSLTDFSVAFSQTTTQGGCHDQAAGLYALGGGIQHADWTSADGTKTEVWTAPPPAQNQRDPSPDDQGKCRIMNSNANILVIDSNRRQCDSYGSEWHDFTPN